MSMEVAKKVIESLDQNLRDDDVGNPHFGDPSVKPFPLNPEGFRRVQPVKSPRKIACIDGGNQEVVGAPNFSIQLNRVYFGMWNGGTRILERSLPRRVEFFSLTFSTFRNGEIHYDTKLFPPLLGDRRLLPDENDLSFSSTDRTVALGRQRADIGMVASISRRFSELTLAKHIAKNELSKDDAVVMDGTLQTAFTNESKYLEELYQTAEENGVIVTGLSKTSALFTDTGLSLLGAVDKLASQRNISVEWYYPIAESVSKDHNVIILVVKLNSVSERIYRFEIQRDQFKSLTELQLNEILTPFVNNSTDTTFPGYPYGLIDADRFARVSYDEVEHYRAVLLSQMANMGKWGKFSRHIKAGDAHSVLNMLIG
jgi:hypothetical protein